MTRLTQPFGQKLVLSSVVLGSAITNVLIQAKGIKNIEDLMREKGEQVRRVNAADSPQDLEFVQQGEKEDSNDVEKLR